MGIVDEMMPGQPEQPGQPQQANAAPNQDPVAITTQAKQEVMAKIPDARKSAVERLVDAGMKVMFDPKTHDLVMKQFEGIDAQDETHKLALGIAALMSQLEKKSKGPFPTPAVPPAASILLLEAIEFLGEAGKLQVTPEFIAKATQDLMAVVMEKLGIDKEQLNRARSMRQGMGSSDGQQPGAEPEHPQQPPQEQPPQGAL